MEQRKIIPLESSNKISSMAKYLKVGETFVPRNETSEGGGGGGGHTVTFQLDNYISIEKNKDGV